MSEQFAEVNGIKLCYEIKGEGEPLILVHGFGAKKEEWICQYEELSKHFKVIRFDNRGAGKSDRPSIPFTMDMFSDDLAGLMDFLKIEKANIVGWSLGGMIVQNFTLKYPEKVKTMILINTNHKGAGGELYKKMRHEGLDVLLKDPAKYFWDGARNSHHMTFRKQMEKDPKKMWFGLWSAEWKMNENTINPSTHDDIDYQANALETHNTLDRLKTIKAPTLLITASHDRLTPKSCMEEIHNEIPNSKLVVIEKAGHGSPLSRADEVNQAILDFLKE
ncbi:MAG: alpha/beta hydrolase [Promethearchaeota archaeon]|nr:MAG: alpha/beta hydrolase [Candidatus Lokiarchaeota archaeon]